MKQLKSKTSLLTVAAILFAVFGLATMANSSTSPFAQHDVDNSAQTMKGGEGKCGEGKCGDKKADHKCGEGKCGDKKSSKKSESKCGEGKCG